jgi:CubicO group peptidase (beta-lactamase class C family)
MTSDEILAHPKVVSNIDLLTAWIESQMAYHGQPGLSIGVVYGQELIWAKGFGYADVETKTAATSQTIYRIASITKLFTATAILQLRDAGKLQLDDPVAKYLPWFDIQDRYPDAPPITIRHLITHTSGLPREAAFPYWSDANFPTREQVIEALPTQETILPTETEWKYSNLALSLAGEIVAAVSGQAYPDYIQTHILDPLGMNSTFVKSPDPDHPQIATGYRRRPPDGSRGISPFTDARGITAAANMSTTVEDLARFAMLQFRVKRASSPLSEVEAASNPLSEVEAASNPLSEVEAASNPLSILRGSTLREMQRVHWLEPDWTAGWGLGWRISRERNKTYISHGGSVPGYRTQLKICPADKTAVIALTNADDGDPGMYAERAFQWVADAILEAVKLDEPEISAPPLTWQRYVGKYRNAWGDSQILILNGQLVSIDPSQSDPSAAVTKLIPVAEHTFRMETGNGFGNQGELVVFELDDAGEVQRVKTGENYTYPVVGW